MTDRVAPHLGRHAVFVSSRDPRAPADHGRMSVLRTALAALSAGFDHVSVFHLRANERSTDDLAENASFDLLASTRWSRPFHAARVATFGHRSLNQMVGIDGAQSAALTGHLERAEHRPDLMVLDGVRAASVLPRVSGTPTLVDLDDLLSARYRAWAELPFERLPFDIFGTNPSSPVNAVARTFRPLLPTVLRAEAKAAAAVESDICAIATSVSLVSPTEAEALAARMHRPIDTLPMTVPIPSCTRWRHDPDASFDAVFLGRVTHLSNLASLDWLGHEVLPALRRALGRPARIGVVGATTPPVERWLRSLGLDPLGFVPDLGAVLASSATAVAPQIVGGGVNTKVLDYAANGVPLVGTGLAFSCLLGAGESEWAAADEPEAFAEAIVSLRVDGRRATEVAAAGRRHIQRHYAADVVGARWTAAFGRTIENEEFHRA